MDGQKGAGRARGQGRASRQQQQQSGGGGGRRQHNVPTPGQPQQSAWGQPRGGGQGGQGRGGGAQGGQGRGSGGQGGQGRGGGGQGRGGGGAQGGQGRGGGGGQQQQQSAWSGRGGQPQQSAWGPGGQSQQSAWGAGGQSQQSAWGPGGQSQQSAWGGGQQQQQRHQPAPLPTQSAWGQPRQPAPSTSAAAVAAAAAAPTATPQQRPQAPSIQGRATTHRENPPAEGGKAAKEDARGSVRGRRTIGDCVATRPKELTSKCGSTGMKVVVQSNYFRVLKKPTWSVYQYRVDFSPDIDLVRTRKTYLYEHQRHFGGFIFDGAVLFSTENLGRELKEYYCKEKETENTILIRVKYVGEIKVTDIQFLQVLNLILRRSMEGLQLDLVGRNFFDSEAKINVTVHRLEIWPGYTTSIRQHEQDILLCAEVTHKIMRTETLHNILMKCVEHNENYQDEFKKIACGMVVLTGYNNKTYRVDDVDFDQNPLSTFLTVKGIVTYVQYYKKRYKLDIRDMRQPLLLSRPTEKNIRSGQSDFIMLIPELARATGLNDEMKSNRNLMRDVADHTRLNPEPRINRLKVFNRRLTESKPSQAVLRLWNLQLDRELVELPGRILRPETILFGNGYKYTCDKSADWNREFRTTRMHVQKEIKKITLIVPRRNSRDARDFMRLIHTVARGMSMQIYDATYLETQDDRNATYSLAIEKACTSDPQILLIVVPNDNAERYSCIKKKCMVDRAVPSQVVNLRTISPRGGKPSGLMSVATKVVIQMNAKLLGAPWLVELPLRGLMTVGFDVCHSARDSLKSFGALVATMDINATTNYFSAVTEHMKGQELSTEIVLNLNKALKVYRETHGALPERILFFRDGVGDGQLQQVAETEIRNLKEKLDVIYADASAPTPCRMAFIVVSKRINTRLFVNRNNPPPGLVVDDVITLPERYDFFLVSQSVRQGTVSPTSYNVIHDTMGLDADRLQVLTYKMTHMYYNWSGTCRVPAVCQYAHKLAFMVAQYLHRSPANALENQLYYL